MIQAFATMESDKKKDCIWEVISNFDAPEVWIPLLDSRRLKKDNRSPDTYYPSELVNFCRGHVRFEPIKTCGLGYEAVFNLFFDHLKVELTASIQNTKDIIIVRITACTSSEEVCNSTYNMILNYICEKTLANLSLVLDIMYSSTKKSDTFDTDKSDHFEKLARSNLYSIERCKSIVNIENFISTCSPVIIENYCKGIEDYNNLKNFEWWKEEFGDQTIPIKLFKNIAYGRGTTIKGRTTLIKLFDMLISNPNRLHFSAYKVPVHDIIGLYDFLPTPKLIPSYCPVLEENIWIGAKGLRSTFHQDGLATDATGLRPNKFHNINFQIAGAKEVVLSPPDQTAFLYPKSHRITSAEYAESEIDIFGEISAEKYPDLSKAKFFKATLKQGELLYIPRGWWHGFQANSNTINHNVFFSSKFS
jgi:hypothetical protein